MKIRPAGSFFSIDYADRQYKQQAVAFADLPLEELHDAG